LFDVVSRHAEVEHIGGLPLIRTGPVSPNGWRFRVKLILDRVAALALLVAFAPALALIAAAVRLSSPGPVLFRQRRVGLDGRVFDLLKFRTMRLGDDGIARLAMVEDSAPGGVEGVDRRTSVGAWLRATSLDEMPQLINVARGEMSIVGPRPERPEYVALFSKRLPRYSERHRVPAGMTGWAQVHGLRGQTSLTKRIEWDNYYIENWSLTLDLRILALTLPTLFGRRSR
jgi:lipopolysaccharide/colanic/teichoic acid biosynthesis glycosyltransferase